MQAPEPTPSATGGTGTPAPHAVVDVVIPARNESRTVAENIRAATGCRYARRVIVVDDGSTDDTADIARAAGAEVVRRESPGGSKAHAMQTGVRASDADHILFVDADCLRLTSAHLDRICEPVLRGEAEMSLGAFDYGPLNWFVLRLPPLSGERIVPRWVWEQVPEDKLDGYTIESRLDEVIARGRHRTAVFTMAGVHHRTKRQKLGFVAGYLRTWHMYRDLFGMLKPFGDIPWRAYWWYLRGLQVGPKA